MLEILDFATNYNAWIASKLVPHISVPALEIGAGRGNITAFIVKEKHGVHISDADRGFVRFLKKRFSTTPHTHVYAVDIEKSVPKTRVGYYSTIYAVNVLEHIKDDHRALVHIHCMLKPGGTVVLLVPAKKFAFNRLDRKLGHYRRYEKRELAGKLERSGFVVKKIEFFNIIGIASWFVRDAVNIDRVRLSPNQISAFEGIIPILKFLESRLPVPVGISLIVVGSRPQTRIEADS